jgi:hypothetical protein
MAVDPRRAPCVECARPTHVEASGTAHEVVGFERYRDQGGTNHVLFRHRTGRVMCDRCATAKQATGNAGQEALL